MSDLKRVTERLNESIEKGLQRTPIDIVVMGPNLTDAGPAADLRRAIIAEASKRGVTVLPEHKPLIAASAEKMGGGHQLTVFEMALVDACDLLVLIPDSPGSLCELGLFATYTKATSKLVILANDSYPKSGTYVADGPLKAAAHHSAEVHFVDYTDFPSAWKHVQNRIERMRAHALMNALRQ